MTWHTILATITKLTELDEFTVKSCESAMKCNFERTGSIHYRSNSLQGPFGHAELIPGSDTTILSLTLRATAAREEYAMRMVGLGKPIDVEIVSPPTMNENPSETSMDWDRKYSLCYELGEQRVWFGIEEKQGKKKLVTVSLHRS